MLKYDDEKIKFVKKFPVFRVKNPKDAEFEKKEKKSRWNAFNLLATTEVYGNAIGLKYNYQMLCELVSENNPMVYELYYYEKPLSEVWEKFARLKAKNWRT